MHIEKYDLAASISLEGKKKKGGGGKAFDKIKWQFIFAILKDLYFPPKLLNWIGIFNFVAMLKVITIGKLSCFSPPSPRGNVQKRNVFCFANIRCMFA